MTLRSISRIVRWLILALALMASAPSFADNDSAPLDLETTRAALTAIDTALKDPNLTDADLQRLRGQNDPLGAALQGAVANMTPRLAASVKRLAELMPKSKEQAPATDAAAAELASEKQKHDALDGNLRAARAMLLQVDDNAARIGARRRELFARQTFARSSSVFNPQLWASVWREAPLDLGVMTTLIAGWLAAAGARLTATQILGLTGVIALIALVSAPVLWVTRGLLFREAAAEGDLSRLRRALAAIWTIFVYAVLPLLALWAIALALDAFDVSEPRVQGVLDAVFDGARLAIVVNAIGRALLAPHAKAWRLFDIDDRSAALIFNGGMTIAAIWAAERLVEPVADAVGSLNIAVAGRALGCALIAIAAAYALHRLALPSAGVKMAQLDKGAPARTLGWMAACVVFAAVAAGYIAFATFIINQALFLSILASVLYLVDVIARDGTDALLEPDSAIGSRLLLMVGLQRNVLAQIVVIVQGLARVAIMVIGAAAVLEPWGVQSQDWMSSLRAAYFGFAVGGVTLSLSSMLAAAAAFAGAVFATRLVQGWLSARLLPHTRLDAGVSNSVSTIFGYVGMILAVLLAGGQVGLDVQKLAIVAGALSVGIGFGLQSIALNFVSGLILLWERGVRVGDWVVVGPDQGYVRRINARSTEIETFDRATLIVPNSNLVTGVVKNWVYGDRVGRIVVSLNVAYESDVEEVREILIAAAKAQDLVLTIPVPSVQFAEFGEWALKFNLVCFVDDVEMGERIRSDLNFDILRRIREANIRIPYPQFAQLRPGTK